MKYHYNYSIVSSIEHKKTNNLLPGIRIMSIVNERMESKKRGETLPGSGINLRTSVYISTQVQRCSRLDPPVVQGLVIVKSLSITTYRSSIPFRSFFFVFLAAFSIRKAECEVLLSIGIAQLCGSLEVALE